MTKRSLSILQVQESGPNAHLVESALAAGDLPCCVNRVESAIEAVRVLRPSLDDGAAGESLPDLILIDLSVSDGLGYDLLALLRSQERTRAIPVITLSDSGSEQDVARAYRLGASSYIVRPERSEEFIIKLAEMTMYWHMTAELPLGMMAPAN